MNRQELINTLKELDGETLEHIIRTIGMEDQMLRQLIMKAPMFQVQELVEEKALLEFNSEDNDDSNDLVYLERDLA
jgi:hypothetical protein